MTASSACCSTAVRAVAASGKRGSLPGGEIWRGRVRTLRAIGLLCLARILVTFVPLRFWRGSLGFGQVSGDEPTPAGLLREAQRLARRVERAAWRLPVKVKCLPQAMALSWMLRRERIAHCVVIAARPPDLRNSEDGLHAWVEVRGTVVLGDLPGPWHAVYRTHRSQSEP